MCGIAGYFGQQSPSVEAIQRTLNLMKNRGPDARGQALFTYANYRVQLLFSRLSILDLDVRANQPFSIGGKTIVFNGEIYNYIEVRKTLEEQGISFHTTSDTEVLLQAYIHYGETCVERFEGMWSFAIWDSDTRTLFLSRDRFGEKPLYYIHDVDGFTFGSEIKFLRALRERSLPVNERHLLRYLIHGYKSLYKSGETYYSEVQEVPAGMNMVLRPGSLPLLKRHWYPQSSIQPMSRDEAIEQARSHLLESVKIRLRADVPLAFCLSGGIDSASLVSIAAKSFGYQATTFSIIESDERYNESDNILATIRDIGCKHHLIRIPQEDGLARLRRLIEYHDGPVATISYYIHSLLSEAISRAGFRVSVSGTSADELFTGYYDHFILHLYEMRNHPEYLRWLKEWEENVKRFVRNPFLQNPRLYEENRDFREHIFDNSAEYRACLKKEFDEPYSETRFCDSLLRNRMMNELFAEATPVILHEDDLNSMMHSIENRSPFLDSRLFRFAYSIPPEHLINNGYGKFILREAVKGILNDKVRLDRQKKGFNASIHSLLDLKSSAIREFLLEPRSPVFDLIDREKIEALLAMDFLPNHDSKFMFNFINVKMFLEGAGRE